MRCNSAVLLLLVTLSQAASPLLLAVERMKGSQISEAVANRHGLTRAWMAQAAIDPRSSELRHVTLFVDRTRSYTVHEISYENRKEFISERDIDAGGALLGPEGAKKKLAHRMLFLKGKNAVVTEKVLPETFLVCVSSRGMVQVIDAETGRTRWTRLVGNPRFDTLRPAVTENQIGVVCGNNLHLLRTVDGLPQKTLFLKHVAIAGPAIADNWIYIPRIDGTMDWYPTQDQTKLPSYFRGTGKLESQASVHPGYVTWMTEDGYLYALNSFTQKVQFEIKLVGAPIASPVYAGDYKIIAATRAGYVVCVDLHTSSVLWRYSTGEPMEEMPLVVGDSVYATNTNGMTTKLMLASGVNVATGDVAWTTGGVKKLLASANGKIYGIGMLGGLVAIDPETGSIVDRLPIDLEGGLEIYNPITNRLLLANRAGLIESFRPTSQVFPEFAPAALESAKSGEDIGIAKKKSPEAGAAAPATAPAIQPSDTADPFAPKKEGAAGEKKEDPNADPFGT
jgi:hypothetical protein